MYRFKTHSTVTGHPQSGHCKSVCSEAAAAAKTGFFYESVFYGLPCTYFKSKICY